MKLYFGAGLSMSTETYGMKSQGELLIPGEANSKKEKHEAEPEHAHFLKFYFVTDLLKTLSLGEV